MPLSLGISGMSLVGDTKYSPVLPLLSASATAAYSLRKLNNTATRAINVRRSNDNATQDIGFVGTDLDVASLLAFVGVNNGFVTTWYDQVGSNNATQATAINQPQIVATGAVNIFNGKPALSNSASTALVASGLTSLGAKNTTSVVVSSTLITGLGRVISMRLASSLNPILDFSTPTNLRFFVRDDTSTNSIIVNQTVVGNTLYVLTGIRDTNTGYLSINGSVNSATSTPGSMGTTTTAGGLGIGGDITVAFCLPGNFSEILIFNSALSTQDRQILERNQGAYYAISVA